jgi:hypothetical protein
VGGSTKAFPRRGIALEVVCLEVVCLEVVCLEGACLDSDKKAEH